MFKACCILLICLVPIGAEKGTYCDLLPKLDFDLNAFYTKYSGKITQYVSLNKGQECGKLEFNATNSVKTIISPKGTRTEFYTERVRAGVFQAKNVVTGELFWDWYFAHGDDERGGFYCLHICDCSGGLAYPSRIHCDITSTELIKDVEDVLDKMKPLLRETQRYYKCGMSQLKLN